MERHLDSKPSVRFEVEKVIGVSSEGNVRTYQVQWAPAWVSSYHLVGCEHLIQEFLQQQAAKANETEIPLAVVSPTSDQHLILHEGNPTSCESSILSTVPVSSEESRAVVKSSGVQQPSQMVLPEISPTNLNNAVSSDITEHLTIYGTECMVESVNNKLSELDNNKFEIGVASEHINLPVKVEDCSDMLDNVDTSLLFVISKEHLSNIDNSNSVIVEASGQGEQKTEDNFMDGPACSDTLGSQYFKASTNSNLSGEYVCSVCSAPFERLCDLNLHFRSHSKPYACTHCDKTFSQNSNLKRHLRIHTGEKLYTCSRCEKTFSQKVHLERHARIHSDEEPGWKGGWLGE